MSVSKSPLPFIVSYVFGVEDGKQHLDYMFRHRHVSQGLSYPLPGSSFKLTMPNLEST